MAKANCIDEIKLIFEKRQSRVYIGDGFLSEPAWVRERTQSSRVLIVSDEQVASHYLAACRACFPDSDFFLIEPGEASKNHSNLLAIYDRLIAGKFTRDSTIVALGGGVVGDLAGFAAATYLRGVSLLHFPTSLLAQIDASVGGKTAINHAQGKNLIGCFYQAQAVFIDTHTLTSLPDREFRAGLAELIKYGILQGGDFCEALEQALVLGLRADSGLLPALIARSCRIKAALVQEDERDEGQRALLNLGHTVAHALETLTEYHTFLHGEAVAIGLYCAALLSHRLGFCEARVPQRIEKLLTLAGLEYQLPRHIDVVGLQAQLFYDKKCSEKGIAFVLIQDFGACLVQQGIAAKEIAAMLKQAVAQ